VLKLIATILTGNLEAHARRATTIGALIAFAAFLAIVGLAYAIAALRTWLATRYDPITADLSLCAAFLVVAVGFAIAARIVSNQPPPPDPGAALTGVLAPMALGIMAEWLKSRPATAPRPQPARAAEVETPAPAADASPTEAVHGAANLGGVALAILPALFIGLLLGRKSRF
jgi:hypothetical protein